MKYIYKPKGVCSQEMIFDIDDNNLINSLEVVGGCNGNLKGIASLIKGEKVETIIEKLNGIKCGIRETSCPDQISIALKEFLEKNK